MKINSRWKHVSKPGIFQIIDNVLMEVKGKIEQGIIYMNINEPNKKYCRTVRSFKMNFKEI